MALIFVAVAFVAVLVGVGFALRMAIGQDRDERPPRSEPSDFVAPSGQGRWMWRGSQESTSPSGWVSTPAWSWWGRWAEAHGRSV